ncbi:ArdC family protein [Hyphomicrobium sp. DY-1]|uniref:ArdC family protein n=1 Tax=Hyphomicrobium sp. DY-1 TaxID=3075650 RepID=UPI0039C47D47
MKKTSTHDIHQTVTDHIIAAIDNGAGEVILPWQRGGSSFGFLPKNAVTGRHYNGINVLQLWAVSELKHYPGEGLWASYKQWASIDAQVRKGEKATLVIFYKEYHGDPDPDVEGDDGLRRVAKASWVFHCSQVDGFALPDAPEPKPPIERLAAVEAFVKATGAMVKIGGDRAFYSRASDSITMPDEDRFTGDALQRREAFACVELHELAHWTGHEKRLHREFGKRFGDNAYALEECCAEFTAAFLAAELGVTPSPRPDHAAYIQNWIQVLKEDNRAIFTAAAKASEAARYLASFSKAEVAYDAAA